ncbi:MAG: sugar transferase [Candidatus Komeilibacteria bacterium]
MKKFELVFNAALVPIDYLLLLAAAILSYQLRFQSFITELRPVIFSLPWSDYMQLVYLILLGWLVVFSLSGLYSFQRRSLWYELKQVWLASSTATLIIILAFFVNSQLFSSRFIILAFWILSIILVSIGRIIFYLLKKVFYRHGYGARRVVVIGQDNNTFNLIAELKRHPAMGFRVIELMSQFTEKEMQYFDRLRNKLIIDEVIWADANLPASQKDLLFGYCQQNQLGFKYIASLLETKLINFSVGTIGGLPVIEINHTRLQGWGRIIKRIYDIILSFFGCIVLIPITLFIGLLIKLDSRGPIFVRLPRVGQAGRQFYLYKYRSMVDKADKLKEQIVTMNERGDGPLFKMKHDPRVTRLGRWLRAWSIDELPQFFNVLRGDMSLVGPRPHEPEEVARYQHNQRKLLTIKPGVTGMAQVSGRSNLLFEEEVRLDTYYIENWSWWLDLQILVKTIWVVFRRQGVS